MKKCLEFYEISKHLIKLSVNYGNSLQISVQTQFSFNLLILLTVIFQVPNILRNFKCSSIQNTLHLSDILEIYEY